MILRARLRRPEEAADRGGPEFRADDVLGTQDLSVRVHVGLRTHLLGGELPPLRHPDGGPAVRVRVPPLSVRMGAGDGDEDARSEPYVHIERGRGLALPSDVSSSGVCAAKHARGDLYVVCVPTPPQLPGWALEREDVRAAIDLLHVMDETEE